MIECNDIVIGEISPWLKGFYAPNITKIGGFAFMNCEHLLSVDFSSVKIIENYVFGFCQSLISISLPVVQKFYHEIFIGCESLVSVSIGTGLTEPTTIEFGFTVFGSNPYWHLVSTENIDLTLSDYVLPKLIGDNIWRDNAGGDGNISYPGKPYVWKSITIVVDIVEEVEDEINIFYIDRNIYYVNGDVFDLELFDINGRLIRNYNNETVIDLNNVATGMYFLKYFDNRKKLKTEKIIVD